MVETTWHGNSTEDKRGTSIDIENVSQVGFVINVIVVSLTITCFQV